MIHIQRAMGQGRASLPAASMASLLLRLFNSDYFSPQLALSYLRTYADHVGITYFLISRLSESFPPEDIEFYWPQYCHLLVTRPTSSRALENFILRKCEDDVHVALLTLWFMQAHLADLASMPESTHFRTCQRVYNRCQRILFEDPDPHVRQVDRHELPVYIPFFEARRPLCVGNTTSALAGMASGILAPARPDVASYGQHMALQQGRSPTTDAQVAQPDNAREVPPPSPKSPPPAPAPPVHQRPDPARLDPVQQVFGQETAPSMSDANLAPVTAPSSPSKSPPLQPANAPLEPGSPEYTLQQKYLCSHFGRTEMQFIQALQDIPARLQQLPKPARLSALRAELTSLNRTLPAEVCFPTWCAGTAIGSPHVERHHRVMRISPSEAVVLNSADRVPYLLHVEVLRDDLDFDPNRRYNRELLHGRRHKYVAPRPSIPPPHLKGPPAASTDNIEVDLTEQMYGSDLSEFGKEQVHESPEKQFGTKNDTLDTVAWAHASSETSATDFSLDEYSQRMRTAAILLAQLNRGSSHSRTSADPASDSALNEPAPTRVSYADAQVIRQRIMEEMMALEEQRMERMKRGGQYFTRRKRNTMAAEDENAVLRAVNKDDPSAAYFRESWTVKKERIRSSSPYGTQPGWDLFSVIVKTGADLRQELFASQLIHEFKRVWNECQSPCWVHYFRIVILNENAGLIETITDAISVHSIKKEAYASQMDGNGQPVSTYNLYDHFVQTFGDPHMPRFRRARRHFMESLAGYAIVSYLLQIKDRHNGNILVDTEGHLIHIDFGFILGLSPGGVGFEAAPFKFPRDYIDILGGMDSDGYNEFKALMRRGFRDARKHAERFILLVELMQRHSHLPCFAAGNDSAAGLLRDRFQLGLTAAQCDEFVDRLVLSAAGSAFTRLYDQYQNFTQNVL